MEGNYLTSGDLALIENRRGYGCNGSVFSIDTSWAFPSHRRDCYEGGILPQMPYFWLCLGILLIVGYNIIIAATAAILSSYLSNYFMLLLMLLGKKYDKLWKRIRKRN